ncbi:SDR family oxidoreductase [Flavobacteriaceae bacterium Ap0902]|nr:SDR family oxidoreductase [Flavobacteriaceae bacterium Ap0902]
MNKYQNRVAYITGGTKGIGFGVAKYLVEKGMRVAISGRNLEDAQAAAKELSHDDKRVLGISSDVSALSDEKSAVKKILNKFGQLDVVLANAGVGYFKPVYELEDSEWHQMLDTNLTGCFHTLKASFEALKASKGYYLTLSSLAGTNFFPKGAGYNASKFGVVGFTQAAMLDLREFDIKVSTIMPGSVKSYFNNHEPNDKDDWKIQPEDIGQIVWDLLNIHPRTLPSKIEVRPTRPDLKDK